MEGHQPECADVFIDERKHKKKGKPNQIDYLVCNNELTLLHIANLGRVDINLGLQVALHLMNLITL